MQGSKDSSIGMCFDAVYHRGGGSSKDNWFDSQTSSNRHSGTMSCKGTCLLGTFFLAGGFEVQ